MKEIAKTENEQTETAGIFPVAFSLECVYSFLFIIYQLITLIFITQQNLFTEKTIIEYDISDSSILELFFLLKLLFKGLK